MYDNHASRRRWIAAAASAAILITVTALLFRGCDDPAEVRYEVIVDATGVAQDPRWAEEVTANTRHIVTSAIAERADTLDVIRLGSDLETATRVATIDLNSAQRNTAAKTAAARDALVDRVAELTGRVAADPVTTTGTDIPAALGTAVDLCRASTPTTCRVFLLSDLEDTRLGAAADADTVIDQIAPHMPELTAIHVHAVGIGASGADADRIAQTRQIWSQLLAGAASHAITRTL